MTNGRGIVYVERSGFYYQASGQAPLSYTFPVDTVNNIEVVNRDRLELEIRTFIQNNKLVPATLTIILGQSICFDKDIVEGDASQQEIEAQKFLENVPFEVVVSKSFPLSHGQKIIASNKDLCKLIKTAFEKEGFSVSGVIPVLAFGANIEGFNQDTAALMLQRFDVSRHNNILEEREIITAAKEEPPAKKQQKNRMLLILFFILIAIAGFLVYYSFALQPQ
ncbi:MAG: hypothetical protein HY429_02995 [Candidatus Levybacteria bacterium]|nr:hypothetical protein [Candidatus Levybacteria bacterium]